MSEQATTAAVKPERRIVGRITSDKMTKTITVEVERQVKHALYGKYVKKSTKLHAHDENSEGKKGDLVAIVETRPLSRTKHFKLVQVLEKAAG